MKRLQQSECTVCLMDLIDGHHTTVHYVGQCDGLMGRFPSPEDHGGSRAMGAKAGWVIPRDVALVLGNGGPGWAWSIAAKPRQHCEPRFLLSHKWTGWCGAWHWIITFKGKKTLGLYSSSQSFGGKNRWLPLVWPQGGGRDVSSEGYLVLKCPMERTEQSLWECFSLDCISLVSQNV